MKETLLKIAGEKRAFTMEPLSRHSTFRIGGPADYFVMPETETELVQILAACKASGTPVLIIGNGSNLLFDDKGFRGCIIQLANHFTGIEPDENDPCAFYAKAGTSLAKAAAYACERQLTGLEFASGIPGSVGGGVLMNAGAYGGELSQCVTTSRYLDLDALAAGEANYIKTYTGEAQKFGYRHSVYQEKDSIILGAFFTLQPEPCREQIAARMKELNLRRKEKQPLEYPSAGSTFKRPQGDFAGRLIEASGLKGFRIGDAMVSEKHAGFVINAGNATCAQVLELIEAVQRRVQADSGILLEPEIKMIKEDDGWNL
ncbi:MAG: UDP-N-acetylmuramate dehydrogenase [Clostridia bacterium]|nr:UDP-N-acetylmuramate dehydrogenase [Clostridia bacterium]